MWKQRLLKTITYRVSTIILAQLITWLLLHQIIINSVVFIVDLAKLAWYYSHEWLWEHKKVNKQPCSK